VTKLKTFFKTETTVDEFAVEYKNHLSKILLKEMNKFCKTGLRLPLSHSLRVEQFIKKPTVNFN